MSSEEKRKWQEDTNKELANDHSVEDFIMFVKEKGGDTK